jgi:radical SAM/Cys-rich protein
MNPIILSDSKICTGVFGKSILALQLLNSVGYGMENSNLKLDLVYNPGGPFLPGSQHQLERDYKRQLLQDFGITFNSLYTITNMPIKRYADYLMVNNKLVDYMTLLVNNYNPNAATNVMCTNTISVSWDGQIYDCDFNQQLGMNTVRSGDKKKLTVFDIDSANDLLHDEIAFGRHCYGCTAGSGSSCQGATI